MNVWAFDRTFKQIETCPRAALCVYVYVCVCVCVPPFLSFDSACSELPNASTCLELLTSRLEGTLSSSIVFLLKRTCGFDLI